MKPLHFLFIACLLWMSPILMAQEFDIYVSSGGNHSIIKYDQNGANPSVFIPVAGGGLGWPQDIIFLEDENTVLVSSFNTGSIKKYDADTGVFIEDFINLDVAPTRMIIKDSLLYVLPWAGQGVENPVVRYQLDGTFVDEYTNTGISQAIGMDWDAEGNFYVSSYGSAYVKKYDSDGNELGFFIDSNLSGPTNIWFDDNGDLIVLDWNTNNIKRFDSEGNYIGVFISGISQPEGIAFLPNGEMLIGDGGANRVKRYDSEGNFIANLPVTGVALSTPNAVVLRNRMVSSVSKIEATEKIFVHPSIGTEFNLSAEMVKDAISLEIYDVSGALVAKKTVASDMKSWQARDVTEGIYFMIINMENGDAFSQKIVVQR